MNTHAALSVAASASSCAVTAMVNTHWLSLAALVVAVAFAVCWLRRVLHDAKYALDRPVPSRTNRASSDGDYANRHWSADGQRCDATANTIRIPQVSQ